MSDEVSNPQSDLVNASLEQPPIEQAMNNLAVSDNPPVQVEVSFS